MVQQSLITTFIFFNKGFRSQFRFKRIEEGFEFNTNLLEILLYAITNSLTLSNIYLCLAQGCKQKYKHQGVKKLGCFHWFSIIKFNT